MEEPVSRWEREQARRINRAWIRYALAAGLIAGPLFCASAAVWAYHASVFVKVAVPGVSLVIWWLVAAHIITGGRSPENGVMLTNPALFAIYEEFQGRRATMTEQEWDAAIRQLRLGQWPDRDPPASTNKIVDSWLADYRRDHPSCRAAGPARPR